MAHILSRCAVVLVGLLLLREGAAFGQKKEPPPKVDDLKEAMQRLLKKADQEYRIFFKKPEKVHEFWSAIKFEIETGKYDVAALHLDLMLQKVAADKDGDAELVKLEAAEGLSAFLRLRNIRQWTDHPVLQKKADANVTLLLDRLTVALDKHLSDPTRIGKFIDGLEAATPEEKAFAFAQLDRSGERAAPMLLAELQKTVGKLRHRRILEAMVKMRPEVVPPLLEVFNARDSKDAKDTDLRLSLLEIVERRGDTRAIPYLWHMSEAPRYPQIIRQQAKKVLARLHESGVDSLPAAKVALTRLAEDYYQHRVKFLDPKGVPIWWWLPDNSIPPKADRPPAPVAEFIFADRYAKLALDLDPTYRPAQVVALSLTLERAHENRIDEVIAGKPLEKPDPAKEKFNAYLKGIDELLMKLDTELLEQTLDRALTDKNLPVILPLVRALGQRGAVRAARVSGDGTTGPLVRALAYPDRRVQFAAATALVRVPSGHSPALAARIVEVLRRFMVSPPAPKALIAFAPKDQAPDLRALLKGAGFEAELAPDLKSAFESLHRAADVDVILIHPSAPREELPHVLSQFRSDARAGLLPLFLVQPLKGGQDLSRLRERYRNVFPMSEALLKMPEEFKARLEYGLKMAAVPESVAKATGAQRIWLDEEALKRPGLKFAAHERAEFSAEALGLLVKMARGVIKGYDLRPTEAVWVDALRDDTTAREAIEVLSTFPGAKTQERFAVIAADAKRGKLRMTAAQALNTHAQRHGMLLGPVELARLRAVAANPEEPADLRALLGGMLTRGSASGEQSGQQLLKFRP